VTSIDRVALQSVLYKKALPRLVAILLALVLLVVVVARRLKEESILWPTIRLAYFAVHFLSVPAEIPETGHQPNLMSCEALPICPVAGADAFTRHVPPRPGRGVPI
jgi:hypothetical protein